jgi:hypothetical protein
MILITISIEKCVSFCWLSAFSVPSDLVLPLNLTYILIVLSQPSWENLSYADFLHSMYQNSCPFSLASIMYPKNPLRSETLWHFLKSSFYGELLAPCPTPKLEDYYSTTYSLCSQLPSISRGPPSTIWGSITPCWHGFWAYSTEN